MAVNQQQLDYLGAMGIPVWISRDLPMPELSGLTSVLAAPVIAEIMTLPNTGFSKPVSPASTQALDQSSMPKKGLQAAGSLIRDLQQTPNKQIAALAASLDEPPQSKPIIITKDLDGIGWMELESTVSQCTACDLHDKRQQTVFGKGNQQASLMIVGDIPRLLDEQRKQPFSGEAGELLGRMLSQLELSADAVYFTNLLKCRPPLDNPPQANQAGSCLSYLKQQIKLLNPHLVLLMGRSTAQQVLGKSESMAQLRQNQHQITGLETDFITTYHPSYLLRQPRLKALVWQDLQFIKQALNNHG